MSNTTNAVATIYGAEVEDRIMSALPAKLRTWLREEAATDICVVQIFKQWRAGATVDNIMAHLRGQQRRATRALYGANHPQASLI